MPVTTKKRATKKAAVAVVEPEFNIEGLTRKEQQFVDFYLGEANLNAAKAARLAGYKDAEGIYAQASRMLRNVKIQSAIEKRLNETAMGSHEILARLTRQARGDIGDLLNADGSFDFETAAERGYTDLIKEMQITERWIPTGDNNPPEKERTVKFKMHDAQAAQVHLGKYRALFTDKTELTGKDGGAIAVVDVEQAIAGFMADAAKAGEPCQREDAIRYLAPFIPGIK